ncbi:MAG: tRNA (adenosine(37)-N6)-threonylcarbamoyltransferase complex dimerization subunit type 1 TsaB [Candidatus Saccharimonadales bacterium]
MILLLDSSTPTCKITFVEDGQSKSYEWKADRELAKGLLGWLKDRLGDEGGQWSDISGLGVFQGPGSFTGLRIGLTVLNTLADTLSIPIVGTQGDDWRDEAITRLQSGENDKIALPYYGNGANITIPRK